MGYDDARFARRDENQLAAAGTVTSALFNSYQRRKAVALHLRVQTAGTAAGFTVAVQNGTTAITTCTLGTNTAGYTTSLDLGDAIIASLTPLACVVAGDVTGRFLATFEYDPLPDSVFSS
jgi:hypothetical protein